MLAAGSGSRFARAAGGTPKQYLPWKNRPLYWHSAKTLAACPHVRGIVFVFPPEDCEKQAEQIRRLDALDNLGLEWKIAPGGPTRLDSVRNGLALVPLSCNHVLAHDAARPFLSASLTARVCEALKGGAKCVVPAIAVTDTIKIVRQDDPGAIERTLPRERLYAAQTPQGFAARELRLAHEFALRQGLSATDDASLLEMMGIGTRICPGEAANVKITNPADMELLQEKNMPMPRCGFGYDAHRYGRGRPLKLGGIAIPGDFEVVAHSDGDALLHALMDAICGCAALKDIGELFPDTDPRLEGISSAILLDRTLQLARERGLRLVNADLTIVAQKPRLRPFRDEICRNIARLLNLPLSCVNVKATTEEGLGFTGRLEGIKAYAVVSAIGGRLEPFSGW